MPQYVVYSAAIYKDDEYTPSEFANGVAVDASSHEDALRKRVEMQYAKDSGTYWVSGPESASNERFVLRRFRTKSTAYELVPED